MCGIVGVHNVEDRDPPDTRVVKRMLATIRHRGPDEFGIFRDSTTALGSARLSIIDVAGGSQPICNEDQSLWLVFNGEAFNYVELRQELEARGHRFRTRSDTEVVLHLYEEYGPDCLGRLNGQFALAAWDTRDRSLFLARDRVGVRPLFYRVHDGRVVFGSEIKSILAYPGLPVELDLESLQQVFTFWSPLSPRTIFRDVEELPPAHYLLIRNGARTLRRYWAPDFKADPMETRTEQEVVGQLAALLEDAVRIRLRADVPVGAYLSGGLDSSLITALARRCTNSRLETFSVGFGNSSFDESAYQLKMADFLGTKHHVVQCADGDIGSVFPEIVWHTETPILRTAPAPLFLLSRLVNEHGLKVVLTGEGADEFLGGYDIFKEMKVRRFWARAPQSARRPLLLRRLYPDIPDLGLTGSAHLSAFFGRGLTETQAPFYSHEIRWNNTARIRRYLSHPSGDGGRDYASSIFLPPEFNSWAPLGQAQYLEASTFLSGYLLSSQGDRVAMAHSVETRHPFLDHRVIEFANRLPSTLKLRGLTEKYVLRQIARQLLPCEIWRRRKRPYRAPVHQSFFARKLDYVEELLSPDALRESALFKIDAVAKLRRRAADGAVLTEIEDMALAGVLSTQIVYHHFVKAFDADEGVGGSSTGRRRAPVPAERTVVVDRLSGTAA